MRTKEVLMPNELNQDKRRDQDTQDLVISPQRLLGFMKSGIEKAVRRRWTAEFRRFKLHLRKTDMPSSRQAGWLLEIAQTILVAVQAVVGQRPGHPGSGDWAEGRWRVYEIWSGRGGSAALDGKFRPVRGRLVVKFRPLD